MSTPIEGRAPSQPPRSAPARAGWDTARAGFDPVGLSDLELLAGTSASDAAAVGRVNTPASVARWMVREALAVAQPEAQATPLTIFEPAAGSGVLIAALVDALSQRKRFPRSLRPEPLSHIWAADADPGIRSLAGRRLRLLTDRLARGWLRTHYRIGDTLLDARLLPPRPIDLIIGNPPYLGVRHARRLPDFAVWRDRFGATEDLYAYFMRWAMETVRPGGHIVLLVPDTWLTLGSYEQLRRSLLSGRLRRLVRLPGGTFDRQVFPCFFVWQKASPRRSCVWLVDARRGAAAGRPAAYPAYKVPQNMFASSPGSTILVPTRDACELARLWQMKCSTGPCGTGFQPVLHRLEACGTQHRQDAGAPRAGIKKAAVGFGVVALETVARVADVGIHSRNCRHRLFYARRTQPGLQRLLQGRQVERYAVLWDSPKARFRWVDVGYVPKAGVRGRRGDGRPSARDEYWDWQGDPAIHRLPERILIRQTGDRIVAARCRQARTVHYTDNTLFTATLTEAAIAAGITYPYLLAYLNSEIVTRLYRFLSGEEGRAQAQVKIGLLRQMPFIWPDPASIRWISELTRRLERAAKAPPASHEPARRGRVDGRTVPPDQQAIDAHFAKLFARHADAMLPRPCRRKTKQ